MSWSAARRMRVAGVALALAACGDARSDAQAQAQPPAPPSGARAEAIFASGCFWCSEADFQKVPGVLDAISGYTGGTVPNPTYEQVSAGGTGHYEAVRVLYDPRRVSYARLLEVFWSNTDPVDAAGQFCDKGESYRAAIFTANPEQARLAQASKDALARSGKLAAPIAVAVLPARPFYAAEAYHQEYATRNPVRYRFYRSGCGRDARLREVWGDRAMLY